LEGLGKRGWIGLAKLSRKEPNVFEAYKALQYAVLRRRNRRGRGGVRSESVSTADIIKAVKELRTPEFQEGMAQIAPFEEYDHEALPPVGDEEDDEAIPSEEEGNGLGEPMANLPRPGNQEPGDLEDDLDDDEDLALRTRVRDILGPDKYDQLLDSVYIMGESLRDAVDQAAVDNYIEQHLQQLFEVIINNQLE
jgi:hypothetical protein